MSALTVMPPAPDAAGGAATPVLAASGIITGFGSHAVLHGIDISVAPGEIAGIFGLNGAGKSVFLKVLSGLVPAWSGRVVFEGRDITGESPERRVALGIGNVPQGRQVFAELTVEQNLRIGAYQLRRRNRERYAAVLDSVYARFPVLAQRRNQAAGTMSGGEQASLAVGRALMSEPRLLLIDEPSAGLAPKIVEELFHVLSDLNRTGLSILLVEQNITFGLKLVHTANLLRGGRVVYSGDVASLDRDRVVQELGIGRLLRSLRPDASTSTVPASPETPSPTTKEPEPMAIEQAQAPVSTRFRLSSGEIAAEISGNPTAPLVIGIPGLSANLRSFDVIFEALDPQRHRRLAYDPRGRGHSEKTPPGTYGWPAHARDIIEMADQLGAATFDLVGWSMGTWIAMKVCELAPGRVRRLVLIDGGGVPDDSSVGPIYAGLERLGTVYPSREEFNRLAQAIGVFQPWEAWQKLFDYELEDVEGGVRARTAPYASWEDENFRKTQDAYAQWKAVTMPSLIVRATEPIVPGLGYILNASDVQRFLAEVPGSRSVEIDAQHYTVGVVPSTARAIAEFLGE